MKIKMDFIVKRNEDLFSQIQDDLKLIVQRIERLEDRVKGLEDKNIREL